MYCNSNIKQLVLTFFGSKEDINLVVLVNVLLFLTCLFLPLSFQISTVFFMAFSILSLMLYEKGHLSKTKFLKIFALPLIIFLISFIGLPFTDFKSEAIKLLVKYLPYLIISISFLFVNDSIKKNSNKFIKYGIVLGVIFIVSYLFFCNFQRFNLNDEKQFLIIFSHKYTYNNFLSPIDYHPTYFGLLVLMSNLFVIKFKWNKIVIYIVLFLNICGIFFISSKIITSIFLAQGVFMLFLIRNTKVKRFIFLLGILFVILFIFIYKNNFRDFHFLQRFTIELKWDLNPKNKNTSVNGRVADDSRLARWNAIWNDTKESIFIGNGSGSERSFLDEVYLKAELTESYKRKYNTHNQYLFFFLENGILGVLIFLIFLSFNINEAFNQKEYEVLFYLCSVALICFIENYLNRTMGVLAMSLFITYLKKGR